jgi:hypothetical protein
MVGKHKNELLQVYTSAGDSAVAGGLPSACLRANVSAKQASSGDRINRQNNPANGLSEPTADN